ncbi:MAG: oligosaccharide flippase family protein [Anaerolineae bacterium]
MNRLQRATVNMLAGGAGYLIPMVIAVFSTPLLLKGLGDSGYGLQNLAGVVMGYLGVMDMNLDIAVVKFLAEYHARGDHPGESRLLSSSLQVYTVVGLLGMGLVAVSARLLATTVFDIPRDSIDAATVVFSLAGLGFLVSAVQMWGKAVINGMQRFDLSNSVSIAAGVIGVVSGLAAVFAGLGVVGYVSVRLVVSAVAAGVSVLLTWRVLPGWQFRWGIDTSIVRSIWGYTGYGVLLRVAGIASASLDRTLIGVWLGVAAVGVYSLPLLVVSSVSTLISSMLSFTFPLASELHSSGRMDELRDVFVRASRFIAAIAVPVFVPLIVLGDSILSQWVGPGIAQQAAPVLRVLSMAALVTSLAVVLTNNLVVGSGRIRVYTQYTLLRAGVVAVACLAMIRRFGMVGAAWGTLIANAVEVAFFVYCARRYLQVSPSAIMRKAYLRPLMLGCVMAALLYLGRPLAEAWWALVLLVGLAEVLYAVLAFLTGVFGDTEKRALLGLWQMAVQRHRPSTSQP